MPTRTSSGFMRPTSCSCFDGSSCQLVATLVFRNARVARHLHPLDGCELGGELAQAGDQLLVGFGFPALAEEAEGVGAVRVHQDRPVARAVLERPLDGGELGDVV